MRTINYKIITVSSKWVLFFVYIVFFIIALLIINKRKGCIPRIIGALERYERESKNRPVHRTVLTWKPEPEPLWNQDLDFDQLKISNETGHPTGMYLVPNYIHFLHFGGRPLNYVQMVCLLAAYKNQNPEKIFMHYDNKTSFTGKYWDVIKGTPGLMDILDFHTIELPREIFGQQLSKKWRSWHGSDVMRIRTIMKYGGVFLDNDCYLIKNLDNFRRFEISIAWDEGQYLGNQIIIAHKNARFLRRWLDCYKVYYKNRWYYNAGEKPTIEVLYKEPELINRVQVLLGTDTYYIYKLLQDNWLGWKNIHNMHLMIRHQPYHFWSYGPHAAFPVEFNEKNIAYYPVTFREMAYDVYNVGNVPWPKTRFNETAV